MKTKLTDGPAVIVKFFKIRADTHYGIGYDTHAMQNRIARRRLKSCGNTYTKTRTVWRIPCIKAEVIRFPVVPWRAFASNLASV
jgi:hypothetical protein